ncbi:uncharacterized protein DUF3270 [Salsuginibacillus halophilus]|uniref:Uncharacterized protein DUF3270 n=1 Tax=Salsuginibacillus halophilus TaxID=517424 RepID=A0A2P8HLC8_9BACI|nr:DUF3270 family protein [Salsuginibacillus halophilus]PSL47025.1 uncharacterized protein DUF3270 [Salsuginibacillus halophilus]
MSLDAFITGLVFIIIHLLTNHLMPASRLQRLRWLSFSAGIAVSYVFVYVLPSLHEEQADFGEQREEFVMESELYFIGLLGLLVFYGVQKLADHISRDEEGVKLEGPFFWIQIAFFTVYNMLISYIVIAADVEGVQAAFYSIAIGTHFIAVAHDLWREDARRYNRLGRFIMAGGIVVGWLSGMFIELSSFMLSIIFAFISGAMILNVLKVELPSEEDAHFPTFAMAAVGYTAIVMALKYFFEW